MKKNFRGISVVLLANLLLVSSPVSHAKPSWLTQISNWCQYKNFTNNLDFSTCVYPIELFVYLDGSGLCHQFKTCYKELSKNYDDLKCQTLKKNLFNCALAMKKVYIERNLEKGKMLLGHRNTMMSQIERYEHKPDSKWEIRYDKTLALWANPKVLSFMDGVNSESKSSLTVPYLSSKFRKIISRVLILSSEHTKSVKFETESTIVKNGEIKQNPLLMYCADPDKMSKLLHKLNSSNKGDGKWQDVLNILNGNIKEIKDTITLDLR